MISGCCDGDHRHPIGAVSRIVTDLHQHGVGTGGGEGMGENLSLGSSGTP